MGAEPHVIVIYRVYLCQRLRIGARKRLRQTLLAVEDFNRVVRQDELLQVSRELPRERDRVNLIVREIETDQLRAQAGEVVGDVSDVIAGEVENGEAIVDLLPTLPRPPLNGQVAVANVEVVLQLADGRFFHVAVHG